MRTSVVLVTGPEFLRAEALFTSAAGVRCIAAPSLERELASAIVEQGARHVVVGSQPYRSELYAALPRGGVLARLGVGYDNIDTRKATEAGLLCTNTPHVLEQSVAEQTLLLIAAAARHLLPMTSAMQSRDWTPRQGVELRDKTLAVIGCGEIGRAVARIASAGFGMRVIGCTRQRLHRDAISAAGLDYVTTDFTEAVRDAHFVSLHIPATRENAHFINADRLELLAGHAWLVNTARGAVVDESALYDALAAQRIAGAALDVFEREPYQPVDPGRDLRALPNVILTPHAASNTGEANRRMAECALGNIALAEAGEFARMDLLNREVLAT